MVQDERTPLTPKVCDKPIITARNTVVQNLLAQQTSFRAGRLRDYITLWEGVTSNHYILQCAN